MRQRNANMTRFEKSMIVDMLIISFFTTVCQVYVRPFLYASGNKKPHLMGNIKYGPKGNKKCTNHQ